MLLMIPQSVIDRMSEEALAELLDDMLQGGCCSVCGRPMAGSDVKWSAYQDHAGPRKHSLQFVCVPCEQMHSPIEIDVHTWQMANRAIRQEISSGNG